MAPAPRRGALVLDLYTAANLALAKLDRELKEIGLPLAYLGVLTEIRLSEPITPTALAARTGFPLTTLTDYLQQLIERGEVSREPNPADRRSHLLSVTPAGRDRLQASSRAVARVVQAMTPQLERPLWEYEDVVAEVRAALTET